MSENKTMGKQRTDLQNLLFTINEIVETKSGWYIVLGDGTEIGPFNCEARAKEWRKRFLYAGTVNIGD